MSLEETPHEIPTPPPSAEQRLVAALLPQEDRDYLQALRDADLLGELDTDELIRVGSAVEELETERRWVQLLALYYAGDGLEVSKRRRAADGLFFQRVGEPATAAALVARLSALWPALDGISLERIGGDEGPLVLRAGEHVCAVLDAFEEHADTDQVDLSDLEGEDVPMVTVRGLVRSTNVLLDRHGIPERMVALPGDADRELYVRLTEEVAMKLVEADFLEDANAEQLRELTAW